MTGHAPDDSGVEDFHVFTAGLSKFVRRSGGSEGRNRSFASSHLGNFGSGYGGGDGGERDALAEGTRLLRPGTGSTGVLKVPDWRGGKGVNGGWDCVLNGDCSYLSNGAERGW